MLLAASLVACWGHLTVVAITRHLFGVFSWKWWLRDQLLFSSVGYPLVFAAISILPIVVHVCWPRRFTLARFAAFEFALIALAMLLLVQRISPWALLVVAIAVAAELHRRVRGRDATITTWSRRIAAVGVTASLVVTSGTLLSRALTERSALRSLPDPASSAPNVLLLILDTVRASSTGLYEGPADNTPHLDARARAGVVFENAYSTASWTLPSHASIFTGQYASHTGADWRAPLGTTYPTLAEVLRDRGYATGGFVANTVAAWYRTGLARGFLHYEDTKRSPTEALLATTFTQTNSIVDAYIAWISGAWWRTAVRSIWPISLAPHGNYVWHDQISADDVADGFLAWQRTLDQRPFFAFLNLFDAHEPYLPPQRYRAMYPAPAPNVARYLGGIRYMDDVIDRLLDELDQRGVLRNTIVVVTSDHGESFGEHKLFGHGNGLYREQIRVPLLILNGPGLVAGTRVAAPVSLRDLGATILSLTSTDDGHPLGGVSLLPVRSQADSACIRRSPVIAEVSRGINVTRRSFAGRADQKSVVNDTVQVIESSLETLAIFDLRRDSLQTNDVAVRPALAAAGRALVRDAFRDVGIAWDSSGRPTRCRTTGGG